MNKVTITAIAMFLSVGLSAMGAGAADNQVLSLNYSMDYSLVVAGHKTDGKIVTPEGKENSVELPNKGKLSLKITSVNANDVKISVKAYDAQGKVIAKQVVDTQKDKEASISVNNYAVKVCALTVTPTWDYANAWR